MKLIIDVHQTYDILKDHGYTATKSHVWKYIESINNKRVLDAAGITQVTTFKDEANRKYCDLQELVDFVNVVMGGEMEVDSVIIQATDNVRQHWRDECKKRGMRKSRYVGEAAERYLAEVYPYE